MGPWVIPAASAAASAVQSYLASRGSRRGYQMGGFEKSLYDMLAAQLKDRDVPGSITAPFVRHGKDIKQDFSRRVGTSAKEHSIIQRKVTTPMAEASGQYLESREARIQALMASLVRGTGTQTLQQPMDIGNSLQDIGWAIWMATHGKKQGKNPYETAYQLGGKMKSGPGAWGIEDIQELFDSMRQ